MALVRALVLSLLIAAASVSVVRVTDACITIVPHFVLPSASTAPRNTHVWVQGLAMPLYGGASFVLVRSDARHRPLSLELRSWELSSSLWQLVPTEPLAEGTRYELWATPHNRKAPVLLGMFATGSDSDEVAPSPPNVRVAEISPAAFGCPHSVYVEGTPGTDGSAEVLNALWLSDAEVTLRYDEPPSVVFVWPAAALGERVRSAEVLDGSRPALTAKRIGVRTVDLAGNLSAAVELPLARR